MKVTVWKLVANGKENHSHIQYGWVEGDFPLPIDELFENQRAWSKMKWSKFHAYLIGGKVAWKVRKSKEEWSVNRMTKTKLNKAQLEKIWKQLDGACEAIERLGEHGITSQYVDFSALVSMKNNVEQLIENKTRKKS